MEGERLLTEGAVRGILVLPEDFSARLMRQSRWPAPAQLLANGTDPNTARILEGYVQGALLTWAAGQASEKRLLPAGGISLEHRYWFNPELRSADFIVPGVVGFVMSMVGTLLTALVVSREWERGTMESMLASPARMGEIIAARLLCYFGLGMLGMAVSVLLAILLFGLPFRGSVLALGAAASLFLLFALALGLFISTLVRSQFVAAQAGVPDHHDAGADAVRHVVRHRLHAGLVAGADVFLPRALFGVGAADAVSRRHGVAADSSQSGGTRAGRAGGGGGDGGGDPPAAGLRERGRCGDAFWRWC